MPPDSKFGSAQILVIQIASLWKKYSKLKDGNDKRETEWQIENMAFRFHKLLVIA
jgi:hypothetical protein